MHRVLADDGEFVWSQGHPCYDIMDSTTLQPTRSYFATGKVVRGVETGVPFAVNYRTLSDYVGLLSAADFVVERLVEPDSRQRYAGDPWYGHWDYTPALMEHLPPTVIFKCCKR